MTTSRDDAQPAGLPGRAGWHPHRSTDRQAEADQAEADLLQLAVHWAITHPAESIEEAETIRLRSFGDTAIPLAGPGAPLVAEFSLAEFAAAIGLPTEAGKRYVGHALELRYRLPRLWKRVVAGDLAAWKARRIADQTTAPLAWRPPGTSTGTSPRSPTRSAPARSTGSSRKPSPGTCPRKPKNAAAPPGTRPTSPSTTTASASPAPAPSPARSTTSTPSTSTTPSAPKPNASATSATPRPSTNAAPSPSATSPAATSPSTTPPTRPTDQPTDQPTADPADGRPSQEATPAGRQVVLHLHLSEAAVRGTGHGAGGPAGQRSGGWRTPGPRSPPRPSATGSAAPTCTSPSNPSSTSRQSRELPAERGGRRRRLRLSGLPGLLPGLRRARRLRRVHHPRPG